ncbi:MAG: S9 family peptidase [Pirellulales bacterium]
MSRISNNLRAAIHQLSIIILFSAQLSMTAPSQEISKPPIAAKKPKILESHGHKRTDNYYWMRERENPEVVKWLEGENAYREAVMNPTLALQEKLVQQLRDRIKQDDESAPFPNRGYLWYARTRDGDQYASHYRKKLAADGKTTVGDEELVLDENKLAEGHEFCEVAELQVSTNGQFVAWPADFVGRRMFDIQIRDMSTGKMLTETIPTTTGNMVFAEDNQHLFYTRQDSETLRFDRLFRHKLGTAADQDVQVYFEEDEEFNLFLMPTKSRRYIQCISMQTLISEIRLIDTQNPTAEPVLFLPREDDHEYALDHLDDRFVIVTNWQAPNNRVMQCSKPGVDKSTWEEVLAHDGNVLVEDIELLNDWMVVVERYDGLTRIRYRKNSDSQWQFIDFGEPCYSTMLTPTAIANSNEIRYTFSSLKTPKSVIDHDLKTGQKVVVKQDPVLGGFDSKNYVTERLWATAKDGVKVPVSIIYHRNTKRDGSAPLMLYAYGSYGISMEDEFIPSIYNLVDRGFVWGIAHIRGGQEMGRHWYDDGKLLKKKNTFSDFVACTEHLIGEKYADPKRVFAQGGSAGGLLMGAVTNLAPQLYKGVIAEVPFLDVVTTMLDDSIPLTTSEYDEWGNPNEKEYYDYMLSYSPYDNVQPKAYPNVLVITGFHDSQVQYWEPAKWVAKMRELKSDNNLLLMDVEMHAGHGGSSGRYDRYKEIAKMQAFVLMLSGVTQ